LVYCYLYSLARLLWLAFGQLKAEVDRLRSAASDPTSFGQLVTIALDLVGPGKGAWSLIVAFPEWPVTPWLAIPPEERERRLKILFPDYYPTHSVSSAKDILPARLPDNFMARIEAAIKAYGLPVIPIGSGCWSIAEVDLMKLQGKEIDWSKLELAPGETPQSFLAVLLLHWKRQDDILESGANLLSLIRPANIPQDKRPTVKETTETQTKYDLKALSAWYLLWRMNWDWQRAAQISEKHLGNPLYSEQGEWIKARKRAEELLGEFGRLNPIQSTDTE
jgi:hypothetical protein